MSLAFTHLRFFVLKHILNTFKGLPQRFEDEQNASYTCCGELGNLIICIFSCNYIVSHKVREKGNATDENVSTLLK